MLQLQAPFSTYMDWRRDVFYFSASHMPTYACVHFLECFRQNPRIATKLKGLAINPNILSRDDDPGSGVLMMASILSMRNLKTIKFLSELPKLANDICQANRTHCSLSKGHRRALFIGVPCGESVKKLANVIQLPLELFKIGFRAAFSIIKADDLLSDYGMKTDHELVLPSFEWNILRREDAARYRTGPYGTNRKKW